MDSAFCRTMVRANRSNRMLICVRWSQKVGGRAVRNLGRLSAVKKRAQFLTGARHSTVFVLSACLVSLLLLPLCNYGTGKGNSRGGN